MATKITINVTNNSPNSQKFFFFQQPAVYSGGPTVYTNSLYSQEVLPYATSGSVLSFTMILQYYAGVQQQVDPPQIGKPSGQLGAIQPIDLTPAPGGTPTKNTTDMTVTSSLGLSPAFSSQDPQAGSFRINIPVYDPALMNYSAGSAVQSLTGAITLSNFVTAQPNTHLDCQPIIKFYVQTGDYTAGTVMNFTSSSATAALCDATPGFTTFNVSYNSNGTWTVKNMAVSQLANGSRGLIEKSSFTTELSAAALIAEVLNEAGTGLVSSGLAANFLRPITVTNLTAPGAIIRNRDYQVGPAGGRYQGVTCTDITGNTAVFD
ncbi:hypothetical protein DYI24_02425 [Rhodopseudomonas sp. BR0C11]|uniref:hypothetical protein n=1 Tax=Rhodopseudomonas sp. BR0C11 TaxID=2269370 RepID=UPI0013DFB9D6|nr:hypothetical protein [Rhodopseudomonas sp. BR0C11]NEV75900.1 hypothetical protein [Rhodopseudomonas sp. BR0C11]